MDEKWMKNRKLMKNVGKVMKNEWNNENVGICN